MIMVGTNINITKKAREFLIKAAAKRNISVETLASEILNQSIVKTITPYVN